MKVNVTIEVKMESGAFINLTESQTIQVGKYVEQVIFGTPEVKEKRKYVRKSTKRSYTPDEDALIIKAMNEPRGKARNKAYKFVAVTLKRTRAAISQRAVELRKRAPAPFGNDVQVSGYRPLEVLRGTNLF